MNKSLFLLIFIIFASSADANFRDLKWSSPIAATVSGGQIVARFDFQWNGDDASSFNSATVPAQIRVLDSSLNVVSFLEVSYGGALDSASGGKVRIIDQSFTRGHVAKMGQFTGEWTMTLPNGLYSIQSYSGLSDGLPLEAAGVETLSSFSIETTAIPPVFDIAVKQAENPVMTEILPLNQTISVGETATFALHNSGAFSNEMSFAGTDGTNLANAGLSISVKPAAGTYHYNLTALGTVHLRWESISADETWIDYPSGISVDISNLKTIDVPGGGTYIFRARSGSVWSSQPVVVMAPNQAVSTATLIVVAPPPNPPANNPPDNPPTSNPPSNPVANAAIGPVVTAFSPTVSNYTVTSGMAAGKTYGRCWQNGGGWTAYLGRDGVGFQATAISDQGAISHFEIQAKSPSGDWSTLTSATVPAGPANGAGRPIAQALTARLGDANAQKPLIPADETLAGEWRIRARAQDVAGTWSPWAFEQSLTVVLPIAVLTKTGQTLPPVQDAAWFTASPTKTYTFDVLVP